MWKRKQFQRIIYLTFISWTCYNKCIEVFYLIFQIKTTFYLSFFNRYNMSHPESLSPIYNWQRLKILTCQSAGFKHKTVLKNVKKKALILWCWMTSEDVYVFYVCVLRIYWSNLENIDVLYFALKYTIYINIEIV